MKNPFTPCLKWFNRHWNKRRTSAAERSLKQQLDQRDEQIRTLDESVRQLKDRLDENARAHAIEVDTLKGHLAVREEEVKDLTQAYKTQTERRRIETELMKGQ